MHTPPWLKLQTQCKGSYRTEDVLDFLDWVLPEAMSPQESIVVMLDWCAAHISEEVAELVRSKGHVLLLHGGGVTGIEQINAAWPAFKMSFTFQRFCLCFLRVICVVLTFTA